MNKKQLAAKIWNAANKMRSKIEANEYKDYILGFIFYKYLSECEERYLVANEYPREEWPELVCEEDEETVRALKQNLGYFIPYKSLFSVWIDSENSFGVDDVRDALSSFTRHINSSHKRVFEKIFDTLHTGLSKLGDNTGKQTKAVSDLIHLINSIPMDGRQDYDVLGFIYEYLISQFAANAGKKAGEFYTPHEVSYLMSELVAQHLQDREYISIYDPTSGSGSLLINIGRSVARHMEPNRIFYYAQELKENTYNLTRMNLVMRGISPNNIATRNADTLEEDWPLGDANGELFDPLLVDAVVSNPPYSQNWEPANKDNDPRYSGFGLAPKTKADYAFLLHDLYHLKGDGIMCIVLPHGVLFRGGEEGVIRKQLIEKNHIHAIIGLPANIFFGTGIPTIIVVLRRRREENDVLIVDASRGFVKDGKNNKLRASDIRRITDAVTERRDVEKFSRLVSLDEIRANDYNLNIPRYVDSAEQAESWDIYASMFGGIPAAELDSLAPFWQALPGLKESLFCRGENGYYSLAVEDVRKTIHQHAAVEAFIDNYAEAFRTLPELLRHELIDKLMALDIHKTEPLLAADIFSRAESLPLVDKYSAYQIFSEAWAGIATDIEIIQTEGFEATRQVDPNMVIKKKDGKEIEVQEGWVGHVLPFELVQCSMMRELFMELRALESELQSVGSDMEELIDELAEDEKRDLLKNEQDVFDAKAVTARVKALKSSAKAADEQVLLAHALRAAELLKNEKSLKSSLKKKKEELLQATKVLIESLSDDDVLQLLHLKWINPLSDQLSALSSDTMKELCNRIAYLAGKYATTFGDIDNRISETEISLANLLGELTGNEIDMRGINELKKLLEGE